MIHKHRTAFGFGGEAKVLLVFFCALFYRLGVWYLKIRWFTTKKKRIHVICDRPSERVQADCHNYFHLKWLVFYYDLLILIILLPSSIESLWPHCCVCHYLFLFRWLAFVKWNSLRSDRISFFTLQ